MRIKIIQVTFATLFVLLAVCLFYLQIIRGPVYKELSYRNSIRLLDIGAPRGVIYDRDGKILADNALSFGVFVVPQEVTDIDAEIKKLSEMLDVPESLLMRSYKRNYHAPFAPCQLLSNIPRKTAILIEESKLDIPGVLVKEIPLRRYPHKEAFAHVVGYVGEIDKKELGFLKSYGYSARDLIGKDGVERVADSFLRGRDGGMQVQVDNKGRQVKVLSFKKPRKGRDVYLTVDSELQNFLWKMMNGKKGAAVFMDPHNGRILSLVSAPSYDPNESLVNVLNDKDAPLLNRAISGQYPPGSLFKIIVAMAGLESGKMRRETSFICHGKLNVGEGVFNCWNQDGHGAMDITDAIIESCNVYFYNAGLLLGMEKICEYARDFGLGKKTGIEFLGEEEGFLPERSWKQREKGQQWYAGDTVNLSIGQGYLLATPLQMLRAVASIANGGELVEPHILERIGKDEIGSLRKLRQGFRKENIEIIKDAMKGVVDDEDGTGILAWSKQVSISGKTGTSQAGEGLKTHAWFAGFAPQDKPEISFVIFLEHGGSGGDVAALIARKAVEFWYKNR